MTTSNTDHVYDAAVIGGVRPEWLGQTAAGVHGISSGGDWLQLCAASAWLLANVAAVATARTD